MMSHYWRKRLRKEKDEKWIRDELGQLRDYDTARVREIQKLGATIDRIDEQVRLLYNHLQIHTEVVEAVPAYRVVKPN